MELPPNSPDMAAAIEQLHRRYGAMEADLLLIIDELAKAGFSDKRWASIARTHVEEAFMAMHRALRDYPGDDPNEYGKIATHQPMPQGFTPPVDPNPHASIVGKQPLPKVEWKDASPDPDEK